MLSYFLVSDDNSSLQSSPWQRDHCWKQAAPRKNVSKEMATFYHKPAFRIFTAEALLLTRRKRRKPYDTKILENGSTLFGHNRNNVQQVDNGKLQLNTDVDTKINTNDDKKDGEVTESLHIKQSSETTNEDMKVECVDPTNNDGAKEVCKDLNEEATKGLIHQQTDVCGDDVEMVKMSPIKADTLEIDNETPPADSQVGRDDVQRMNTSDCDGVDKDSIVGTSMKSSSLNGNVSNEDSQNNVPGTTIITPAPETETECNKQGDEEKRLKKPENIKNRAKLNTIVQKLMDASASRIAAHSAPHSFKNSTQQDSPSTTNAAVSFTPPNSSSLSISSISLSGTSGGSKNQNPKVSPPSNTAASRLVEYHQQHVSPRKRILREFEKVSLEDNSAAAGGKRSRAKGNNIVNSTSGHSQNLASSQMNKGTSSIVTHTSNSGNQSKQGVTGTSTTAPTKLYSSYSIHSLLGGSTGSNASVSTSSSSLSSKKSSDLPATITSYHQQQQQHQSPTSHNVSHHQSPKSPDGNAPSCGGKSPSNSASKFKRSSPYSSPMRESHSRSPTSISGGLGYEYGRRSPRLISDVYNKMKYAGQSDTTGSPQHNPQHYHHAPPPPPQSYYSPYMTTSPHYVPPSSSLAAASALSPPPTTAATSGGTPSSNTTANSSRSPRHQHSSAFRATTPTSSTTMVGASISNHSTNIPSTPRGDLSPQRSTTASPRETTPRTVPKKTASIRRQFASPTTTNNNSSCPSPTTENRSEENDRRTPLSHQQHLLHRASPGSANMQSGSPLHHTYSYMYAHGANSPHHPASAVSPTTSNPSSAAAAAAIASYIPAVVGSAYYHPYISTLAAMRHPQMWMQHYQNAAVAAANPALLQASRHPAMLSAAAAAGAAARLSPPYHGYQYNGVNNAAMAAAAAAGFGGGPSSATPPHHHAGSALPPPHGSMFNSMVHGGIPSSHPAAMNATAAATAGLVPASASVVTLGSVQPMTDTTDLSKASKNNYSSSSSSSLASSSPLPGTGNSAVSSISATTSHSSMYPPTRNKDEQSSG